MLGHRGKGRVQRPTWRIGRLFSSSSSSAIAALSSAIEKKDRFKSRGELFEEIERAVLKPLSAASFEYAEWKSAKVHPDYLLGAAPADRAHPSRCGLLIEWSRSSTITSVSPVMCVARSSSAEPAKPTPQHSNIRGSTYYQ
ncbi:hypothetical protein NKH56_35675 [Mesorhizobium sp. M1076]|uniref:hypothetical protein n=1 Tax=Mesorhizobium sp. M1076 TaxID=2957054 RepID=UPI00333A9A33